MTTLNSGTVVLDCSMAPHGLMQVWETSVGGIDGYFVDITTPRISYREFVGPRDGKPATRDDAIRRGVEISGQAGMFGVVMVPGTCRYQA